MRRLLVVTLASALALTLSACSTADGKADSKNELNLYSSRHYDVDKKIYDMFTKETGIKVNVVGGKAPELIERLTREKDAPQADVFLTVGAESIWQLNDQKILGDYSSQVVEKNIPQKYRGTGWVGIAARARVVAYVKDQVDPASITTYDDLTKPEWKGQLLARSGQSSYNQALEASFVDLDGAEKATAWAKGVADNFAREPEGNDRDQAKAIVAGEGKIAIMNSYYWALMDKSSDPEEKKVAEQVGLIFPENAHLNLSYAGMINGAKHKENALKFMEFLTTDQVQTVIAEENGEFPLNPSTAVPEPQKSWGWGEFSTQDLNFEEFGKHIPEATEIFAEVGWK